MKRIKSGDTVIVIAGKSKGHVGTVMQSREDWVFVEGVTVKKAMKPNPNANQPGGIIEKPAKVHASNVAMYNSVTKKKDKVGFKFIEKDGSKVKVRYFKSNDELIDVV